MISDDIAYRAPLPPNVLICETCGTGQGYIWPMASNGNDDHYYVERCDLCERFHSDEDAANYLASRLTGLGLTFDRGEGDVGLSMKQPFIENIE